MLKNDGATEKDSSRRLVDSCLGVEGDALVNPGIVSLSIRVKWMNLCFQEKLLVLIFNMPVPQTDTGGRGENLKTREITLVKELGKLTP